MIDFPANPTVGTAIQVGNTIYRCVSVNPAVWSATTATSGIPDAPADTKTYGRKDGAWDILTKVSVGLDQVNNTSDANKPISTATQTALNGKEPNIVAGTTAQYWRGDKSWQALNKTAVGLPNVDNTADATKSVSYANSSGQSNNSAAVNSIALQWRDPGGGSPAYVMCATSPGDAYVRPPSALSVGYANNSGQVSGIGGWSYNNWGNNPAYLWATEGDGQQQHLTQPGNLSVAWANRVGSVEGASGGTISSYTVVNGDFRSNGGTIYSTYDFNTSNGQIRTQGSNGWRWHWNGSVGDNHLYAFVDNTNQGWASLNSDERLKEAIKPLVSDTEAFMRLKPINFKWRIMHAVTRNEKTMDGLSAQNVRDCFPDAAFGDFDTPPDADGRIAFPGSVDDRAVIAHVIAQLQKLITRVDALEAAP